MPLRWAPNCPSKGSLLQKEAFFLLFVVPELAFWEGLKWTRWQLSSIYIYTHIYIYVFYTCCSLVESKAGPRIALFCVKNRYGAGGFVLNISFYLQKRIYKANKSKNNKKVALKTGPIMQVY